MSNGLSIIADRAEVLAMFRTWLADRALIRIEFRFRVQPANTWKLNSEGTELIGFAISIDDAKSIFKEYLR